MNSSGDEEGDEGANGGRKRSLSEMISSQEHKISAAQACQNVNVNRPAMNNEEQLAWELLRVVVRLNEEDNQRKGQASTDAPNAPNSNNGNGYANSTLFNKANSTNANGQAQAPGIDQMISNHQPLWSQVPLINCLAVLLVLQRLEQLQKELNQQATQFQQMSQLLSGILGQQFRLPFPAQPSLMDCILSSCQRDPASLLGSLVAGLFTTSQRQQEQQRMMQSLQQQITASLFQQVQPPPASFPSFGAPSPQFAPPQLNLSGQNGDASLQAAIQQIFQQQSAAPPAAPAPQVNQGTATLDNLLRGLFGNQQDSSGAGTSPLIAALLQGQQQPQSQGQEKRANSAFDDDSEDVSESDDISLGEDSNHHKNHRSVNNFIHVPEFVNIRRNPWNRGRANQKPQVHVVPSIETVKAVSSSAAAVGPQDNSASKQNRYASKAIMPPPRQDMEMVSSLSDAEQGSDSSTASSLTMGSVRSTAA